MNTQGSDDLLWRDFSDLEALDYISEPESFYEGDISALILDYQEETVIPEQQASGSRGATDSKSLGKRKESSTLSGDDSDDFKIPSKRTKTQDNDTSDSQTSADPDTPCLIAHCPKTQRLMERVQLSRGVRYELARLVTSGKLHYSDITEEKLLNLQGPNEIAAPKIAQVFQKASSSAEVTTDPAFAQEIAAHSPWKELDREEEALSRGPYEGLGNSNEYPDWYGGKVEFRGRLQSMDGKKKSYKIVLDQCTLGPSSRFARRFGSWSFLRVKIPQQTFHDPKNNLNIFFRKAFIIWGQVFRACYAKGDNIFFYWTNESFPSGPSIPGRLSFEDFISWHNPLEENSAQLMTKWSARTPLGFSNSVPGPRISQDYILHTEEIVSEEGSEMTDGCGLSTKSIHRALLNQLSLGSLPTAFQFRLAGYKGMFLLRDDGEFQDEEKRVWVRPSQTKIKYPKGMALDPAMLTIDILRTSHMRSPSRISSEIIINLAENGVPHSVFVDLLKTSIQELVRGLTTWDGPDAMFNLWMNVERAGGVLVGRRAREAVGEARVRGYSNRSSEDVELDEEDTDEDGFDTTNAAVPRSIAWWADQISGCPSTLEETVMVLLDSGFLPQESPVLREKLKQVVVKKIESRTQNLRFELEQSCTAFAVPDPFGVLGPEEVQIKSSRRNLKTQDGLLSDIILGDVLITRNPCKLPSDVRKVKAVEHPMLRNYVDVIVFSIQGLRRLIDYLAGGDHDGDIVLAMWAGVLLLKFQNADEKFSHDAHGLDLAFTRDKETGGAFLQRTRTMEPNMRIHAMQAYLLGALHDPSLVGKYSVMHNNAIYKLGYGHPRTHKIACKFVRVLDAPKTGYRIKPETLFADLKLYNHPHGPHWQSSSKKDKKKSAKPKIDTTNIPFLKRDTTSQYARGVFIMDRLRTTADQERDRLLGEMETLFAPLCNKPDPDLTAPWDAAQAWAENGTGGADFTKMKRMDLSKIAQHVQTMYRKHKSILMGLAKSGSNSNIHFTNLPIEVRQDQLRALSKAFATEGPQIEDLPTIADKATLNRYQASYAYKYDAEQNLKDGVKDGVVFRGTCPCANFAPSRLLLGVRTKWSQIISMNASSWSNPFSLFIPSLHSSP
ncbi:RNA dependent RNA polymerase-domain-containing protein [Flammula alnicola]|nr:RNA dependent RNA polymerase-domain-containing protein [Flammula alnicola]